MYISTRWISCATLLSLCFSDVYAQDDEIDQIVETIRSASDVPAVRQAMAELVEIDSPAAAAAFASELIRIDSSLDRANEESLVPYLSHVFDFTDTAEIRQDLVPAIERLLEGDVSKYEKLFLSAASARFGAQDKVQWLIDEYRQSKPDPTQLSYTASAFELLCRTNQDSAVRFVVEEAVQSVDPTEKLVTERCFREMGNPASLELMRRWDSVESGDFDLIVAKNYLQSIAEFGDSSDIEFVDWIDSNAEDLFDPEAFASQIRPLVEAARARIDERAGPRLSLGQMVLAIFVLGIVIVGFAVYKRRQPT